VIGLTIETKVALVVRGIPEKNAEGGGGGQWLTGWDNKCNQKHGDAHMKDVYQIDRSEAWNG
jgi:hypothetical protein